MGKLHTLRRAILRHPERWTAPFFAAGARQDANGQWYPCGSALPRNRNPYHPFIQHTLTRR